MEALRLFFSLVFFSLFLTLLDFPFSCRCLFFCLCFFLFRLQFPSVIRLPYMLFSLLFVHPPIFSIPLPSFAFYASPLSLLLPILPIPLSLLPHSFLHIQTLHPFFHPYTPTFPPSLRHSPIYSLSLACQLMYRENY